MQCQCQISVKSSSKNASKKKTVELQSKIEALWESYDEDLMTDGEFISNLSKFMAFRVSSSSKSSDFVA